jgi:MFS transporter, ACS family, glucarate transporter
LLRNLGLMVDTILQIWASDSNMKYRHQVLHFLFLLSIITFLDRVCMNVVGKYIKQDLHFNNQQFGYVLGAFSLAYALFELPTGMLGDTIGPRKILTRVVIWFSTFTALTATALNFWYLLLVRFLFGAGEAGAYPNTSIVISKWFPVSETGKAQSIVWAAARLGGALTPIVVLPLVHSLGWRKTFLVLGTLGTVWAMAWHYWFRNEPADKKNITSSELHLIESQRSIRQVHATINLKKMFRYRQLWLLMLMCHLFFYGSYFFTNWSSIYFQEGRGMTENESKNFISLSYLLGAVGCLAGGFISDKLVKIYGLKWGRRLVAITGLSLSAAFFLVAGLVTNNSAAGYCLSICVLTKDMALPVAFATCIDMGKTKSGTVTGAMNFAGQLGGFFITILFGNIVSLTKNFNYPLYLIAACLLVSALLWLYINPEKAIE